jgi:hypothetical protein
VKRPTGTFARAGQPVTRTDDVSAPGHRAPVT